ncbi:hypothetical protein C8Q72DRAFT_215767 [Fomitopsis betulina]|nr:hypothetical protein C8Q72DRAFT_215767 [Fomitopsis betulina]
MCEQCGTAPETAYHYLRECPAYIEQRERMDGEAGEAATQLRSLLNSPKTTKHLFAYINSTGRLRATYGDLDLKKHAKGGRRRLAH